MPDEFPMTNSKELWQNQPTEPIRMPPDEIRRKAKKVQIKRRIAALASIAIGLFIFVVFARNFVRVQEVVPRIGWGILSLWGLYGVYQAYKWIWPGTLAPTAGVSTSLDVYRKELERMRDHGRHIWRRSGLPFCFLGLALIVLPTMINALQTPRLLMNTVPFFTLLAIWFVVFFFAGKRRMQKLQRQIDELNALERDTR